jgi:hypothetical protein
MSDVITSACIIGALGFITTVTGCVLTHKQH